MKLIPLHIKSFLLLMVCILLNSVLKANTNSQYILEIRKILNDGSEELVATYGPKESFTEVPAELKNKIKSLKIKDGYYEIQVTDNVTVRGTISEDNNTTFKISVDNVNYRLVIKRKETKREEKDLVFEIDRYKKMVSSRKDFIRFLTEKETELFWNRFEKLVEETADKVKISRPFAITLVGKIKTGYCFIIFSAKQNKSNKLEITEAASVEVNSEFELVKTEIIKETAQQ